MTKDSVKLLSPRVRWGSKVPTPLTLASISPKWFKFVDFSLSRSRPRVQRSDGHFRRKERYLPTDRRGFGTTRSPSCSFARPVVDTFTPCEYDVSVRGKGEPGVGPTRRTGPSLSGGATRRSEVYGVVTRVPTGSVSRPSLLLYPPRCYGGPSRCNSA